MKKLFFSLVIICSTLVLGAQLASVHYTFKLEEELISQNSYAYTGYADASSQSDQKPVSLKEESGEMQLRQFRQFALFQKLIRQIHEEGLKVHSYKLVRETNRFDPEILQSYGHSIGAEAQDMILKAGNGDKYILYDIQVKCPTGEMFRLPMIAVARVQ